MYEPAPVAEREHTAWWEWLLKPFSKVHKGEHAQVLLLLACVFLILTSYYLLKTAREGLILSISLHGIEGELLKSYAGAGIAVLFVGIVPAYDALAKRVKRIRLLNISYLIIVGVTCGFFALSLIGVPVGLPFFMWIGIINMFLIAQFWSYANDLYTEEQGKRLFAVIAIGGSIGAIVGPPMSKLFETFTLLPIAAAMLVATMAILNYIERRHGRVDKDDKKADEPIEGKGGFALILSDRYLLFLALMVFVAELVKTNGEFILSDAASTHAHLLVPDTLYANLVGAAHDDAIQHDRREVIKAFYGNFYFYVNIIGFVLQAFFVSRIFEKLGVRRAIYIMPAIAFGTYAAIGTVGGLLLIQVAKVAENATEYSLQNTVRQALFLPTSRAAKYKAKAAIDTFIVRAGDLMSAAMVWFLVSYSGLAPARLALINGGVVVVWIGISVLLARRHKEISRESEAREARDARIADGAKSGAKSGAKAEAHS